MALAAVDLFAGPGGWDEGLRELGVTPLGIELDDDACATREAAGHATLQADVAALEPSAFAPCDLLVASPPCPSFSTAGKGAGRGDLPLIGEVITGLLRGDDRRGVAVARSADARSLLIVEPLRWTLSLEPTYVLCEQVPPALEVWAVLAWALEQRGYSAWSGVLNAADYGVPQTRSRAFLIARRDGETALPPSPTHTDGDTLTIDGELTPWVTMVDALGWDDDTAPAALGFPRRADGGSQFVVDDVAYRERDLRPVAEPAPTLTEKARSWQWVVTGGRYGRYAWRSPTACPAPPITTKGNTYVGVDGEAPSWRALTLTEAATLQGFPSNYPWHGTQTARFAQIGNAVPPPLARAVAATLLREPSRVVAA